MDEAEQAFTESLIQTNRSHLQVLEQQAAAFGIMAPPYIVTQIAEYRQKIAELEARLRPPSANVTEGPRHNLPPRDYEKFVGRQSELAEVRRLLGLSSRAFIVTIDGIGGIGKSTLVLESAYSFVEQYAGLPAPERFEAIIWVSAKSTYLTATGIRERRQIFRTLSDVFAALARVLDYPAITRVRIEEQREIVEQVLRRQRTLLILDNLETIDDDELMDFLHELPEPTKALVTTRHRIDVARPVRLKDMPREDALELIRQEATQKQVTLAPAQQDALWKRTGGIPLAIVWSIGLMGLGGSVENVLHRLNNGQSDIARFCFDESMAQIQGRNAHLLLMALSLFAVDASREALGVVAGLGDDIVRRDEGLQDLLRLSVVNREGERFSLLPLTRGFIDSQMTAYQEWREQAITRRNHYVLNVLEWKASEERDWLSIDRIEQELPNYIPLFFELAGTLRYLPTDQDSEGRIVEEQEPLAKDIIHLSRTLTWICRFRGYWNECEAICRSVLAISRAIGNMKNVGYRCQDIGWIRLQRHEFDLAAQWIEDSQDAFIAAGDLNGRNYSQHILGLIALRSGDLAQATSLIEHSYEEYLRLRDNRPPLFYQMTLGELAEQQGDLDKAASLYRNVVSETRHANNLHYLSFDLLSLARVRQAQGDSQAAHRYYSEALSAARACGRKDAVALALYHLARLEAERSQFTTSKSFTQEAIDLFCRLGMKREQADAEALLAKLLEESQTNKAQST